MASGQDSLANALKNKPIIVAHMRQHQKLWDAPPELDPNAASHPIQVFVRVRPLLQRDVDSDAFSLVMVQAPRTIHFTHPTNRWAGGRFATKTYDADGVFDEETNNDTVYSRLGLQDMIQQALSESGHEFCVMAYGQTGTGKTYTTTALEERLTADLFSLMPDDNKPKLSLTAFEIRGGKAYDLLSEPPHSPVQITSTNGSSASYPGLSSHPLSDQGDLVGLLAKAKELRMTRSTVKNDTSSRSHCIVTLRVEHVNGDGSDIVIVDLAGSERSSYATKNDPERVKESIETNKGLAALKDCIRARLSSATQHIPWRGSKLTMVLRGAFEQSTKRSSKLIVLACVSPSVIDSEDTMGTLKYITPFQLTGNAAVDAATDHTAEGSVLDNTAEWSHEDSVGYIKRQLPKLIPVIPRLLPDPSSTIESLFPLSSAELLALASTPTPDEDPATPLLDSRSTNQLRSWIDAYHKKLAGLQKRSVDEEQRKARKAASAKRGVQRMGATKEAQLLRSLDGLNLEANETGFVTRIDRTGQVVQVPAKEE
ncbi:hypothetical protein FRB90_004963 [Tulasnella sp. 427]|nr:hypothetical protein FRB90_004963 [Tulasnella sp. 427]